MKPKKYKNNETHEATETRSIAGMAIATLERIREDYSKKQEALDYVVKWIEENRIVDYSDHKIFHQKSFESLERGYKRLFTIPSGFK